jgi:hypothetical protein
MEFLGALVGGLVGAGCSSVMIELLHMRRDERRLYETEFCDDQDGEECEAFEPRHRAMSR